MTRFDEAVRVVLRHEGGFVDDPVDPGGATNWGISLRFLRQLGDSDGDGWLDGDVDLDGDLDASDIRTLRREDAVKIYRQQWWDRYGYARIQSAAIAVKVFDLAANTGPGRAHRLLQRALRAAGRFVQEDGALGPETLGAVTLACSDVAGANGLLFALRSEAAGFYRSLVAAQPARSKYLRGWLRRAYW